MAQVVAGGRRGAAVPAPAGRGGRGWALGLATLGFLVNFWAWSLLGPLAPRYKELLALSPLELSVLVAVPVIVGSVGRIPLGGLTDRYGGRLVFAALSFVAIVPVLLLAAATSYVALLAGGLLLGVAGASFAVGVPFVNAWFPPERRGLALGIYGMGNIGTAVSAYVSPRLWTGAGRPAPYLLVAVVLAVTGAAFLLFGRNAPAWVPATGSTWHRFRGALRLRVTLELSTLYAITFGGFVAFGVYLPTYLRTAYRLPITDAATRTAGFVLVATLARPLGGWLADRYGGETILRVVLSVLAVGAVAVAFTPGLVVLTVAMLTLAAALGAGNGAVFALVGRRAPATQIGAVTGVVGAAGGLGGFLPPIVMGLVYEASGSYAIGLMLLSDIALAGLVFTVFGLRSTGRGQPT